MRFFHKASSQSSLQGHSANKSHFFIFCFKDTLATWFMQVFALDLLYILSLYSFIPDLYFTFILFQST